MSDLLMADPVAASAAPGVGIPTRQNLLPYDGEAYLIQDDSFDWPTVMRELIDTTPWEQKRYRVRGNEGPMPRLIAWYSDVPYSYSGVDHPPAAFPPLVQDLRLHAQDVAGASFNSVLMNFYRTGGDRIGLHSDNERGLGDCPTIASLSLGAERRFRFKHRTTGETIALDLKPGSWLVMAGETQRHWLHELPKALRVTEPRINLTFRRMLDA